MLATKNKLFPLFKSFTSNYVRFNRVNGLNCFNGVNKFNTFPNYNFTDKTSIDNSDNNNPTDTNKVPITISPYFSKAVSEREKNPNNVDVTRLLSKPAKDDKVSEKVTNLKQKLESAKRNNKSKRIGQVVENIKRELPDDL